MWFKTHRQLGRLGFSQRERYRGVATVEASLFYASETRPFNTREMAEYQRFLNRCLLGVCLSEHKTRDTSLCRTFGREWDRTRCRQRWAGTRLIVWSVSLLLASSMLKVACLAPVSRAPRGALSVVLSWLSCATSFLSRFETFLGQHWRQNVISGYPPSVSGFWHVRRSTIWTCTPTDTPRQKNDKFYRCKRTLGLVFRIPPFLLLNSLRRLIPWRQVSRRLLVPNAFLCF